MSVEGIVVGMEDVRTGEMVDASVVDQGCFWFRQVWLLAGICYLAKSVGLTRLVPPVAKRIYHELKPFYLTALMIEIGTGLAQGESVWGNGLKLGLGLFNWWVYKDIGKDDDDDRWKRRKAKLKEKVEALNGKLVVVPQGA